MSKTDTVKVINKHAPAGFAFFIAWVGALVYFVHISSGFWGFIAAILKSFVWPGFVVYHVLTLLHA